MTSIYAPFARACARAQAIAPKDSGLPKLSIGAQICPRIGVQN
jgi:hypothetical protein